MMTRETEERREYYRIEDCLALEILPADAASLPPPALFELLAELHQLDTEAQPLLRQIGDRDRSLASYLKLQAKRLELLGQAVAQDLLRHFGPPRPVTLSEGGIRFLHPQPLTVGGRVTLRLLLLPDALGLQAAAEVLQSTPGEDGQHRIALAFEFDNDAQRQLVARHVLKRQARERRQAREATQES